MLINENWSPPPPRYGFRVHFHKIVSLCCGTVLLNYLLVSSVSPRALHTENMDTRSPRSLSKQGKVVWNSSLNQHFLYGTIYCNTDKTKFLNNKTKTCEQNVLRTPLALVSRTMHLFCVTRCLTPKWCRSWPMGNVWLWPNKCNVHECHWSRMHNQCSMSHLICLPVHFCMPHSCWYKTADFRQWNIQDDKNFGSLS